MSTPFTERLLLDRLHDRYGVTSRNGNTVTRRYSRAEHVASSAGFSYGSTRIADYVAIDTYMPHADLLTATERTSRWSDRNGSIHGHEIKTSRADWLTELRDPGKAEAWAKHCHHWWLVAPRDVVRDDLPEGWGWIIHTSNGLRIRVHAPRRDPEPMGPTMLASLARAITKTETTVALRKADH